MVWDDSYHTRYSLSDRIKYLVERTQIVDQCFIRKYHKCGKIKGASKSCFVACPREDNLETILELISEKLAKVGVEAIIAVKERAYGQDIFCTKICGKIIESRFCIVILDDLLVDGKNIPNPNVYYEYGLMTSLDKHIIPLQKEDLQLAFNIQSYDTIKYNPKNIGVEVDRAIKDAIKITEKGKEPIQPESLSQKSIFRSFELAGFEIKGNHWFLYDVINDTQFKGFSHSEGGFYLYLGKIDNEEDVQSYLDDINIVFYRTEMHYKKLEDKVSSLKKQLEEPERGAFIPRSATKRQLEEIEEWTNSLGFMSKMYMGFIISPQVNRTGFIQSAEEVFYKQNRFFLTVDKDNEIQFGNIIVKLSTIAKSCS